MPPRPGAPQNRGAVAQLVEHLLCKQGVVGSSPIRSTLYDPLHSEGKGAGQGEISSWSTPRP